MPKRDKIIIIHAIFNNYNIIIILSEKQHKLYQRSKMVKFRIFVVMGCVVVTVAPHLCDVPLWPSPVLSLHPVLEQQQKTRNIKSNH